MRRMFWVGVGAVAGVYVATRLTRVARDYSPSSIGEGLREFAEAVREFSAEREKELRAAVAGDVEGHIADPRHRAALLDSPAGDVS